MMLVFVLLQLFSEQFFGSLFAAVFPPYFFQHEQRCCCFLQTRRAPLFCPFLFFFFFFTLPINLSAIISLEYNSWVNVYVCLVRQLLCSIKVNKEHSLGK